ncbi:DUF3429 domain-containing protein [Paracoccus salsus]|uniref:DUF3429 domain-containing protein n=1 Tax=Paracoccus salsus TaxID=2911061 RepID=UPI001F195317|nr:DUF3429 domain-containing protein [Paracoccus salsus]MCF3972569.1 DUF3429 domain-containing protein [Paracoccus salsus]
MRESGSSVPVAAALLGAAGLLPFLWAVIVLQTGQFALPGAPPRAAAMGYGLMIFSYMAGCFWPFAARSGRALDYGVAVAPVLVLIALVVPGVMSLNMALILGFAGLLPIDWLFWRRGVAPGWWMRLRLPLSAVVIACLVAIMLTGGAS